MAIKTLLGAIGLVSALSAPAFACPMAGVCAQGFSYTASVSGPLARPWGAGRPFATYGQYSANRGLTYLSTGGRLRVVRSLADLGGYVKGVLTIGGVTVSRTARSADGYYTGYYKGTRLIAQAPNFTPGGPDDPNVSSQCSGSNHEGC